MQSKNVLFFSVATGLALGLGIFTFLYARGYSYLTNDPAACANCHVMNEHFNSWIKSSHHAVAVCNDCHTPPGVIPKYMTKASNGFWHSFYFTTGTYPDPIRITDRNKDVLEKACRKCHESIVEAIEPGAHIAGTGQTAPSANHTEGLTCTRCHATVGHWVR